MSFVAPEARRWRFFASGESSKCRELAARAGSKACSKSSLRRRPSPADAALRRRLRSNAGGGSCGASMACALAALDTKGVFSLRMSPLRRPWIVVCMLAYLVAGSLRGGYVLCIEVGGNIAIESHGTICGPCCEGEASNREVPAESALKHGAPPCPNCIDIPLSVDSHLARSYKPRSSRGLLDAVAPGVQPARVSFVESVDVAATLWPILRFLGPPPSLAQLRTVFLRC